MPWKSWTFSILLIVSTAFAESVPLPLESSTPDSTGAKENFSEEVEFDCWSEAPGSDSAQVFSPLKFSGMVALTAATYGAAYGLVFAKGWWDEEGSHFHFENDFEYAKNVDKLGHFSAGVLFAEVFYQGYHWAGLTEFSSYTAAAVSAMLTHVAIDVKDGFSPEWGFSIFDVLSGTLGGLYPMAKRYIPAFKYFDLKWSYWINTKAYYRQSDTGVFTDDYCNQTYWVSLKIYRMLPQSLKRYYPSWLALAAGLSIDEGVFQHEKGHYEIYIALDYDLEAVFKPQKRWSKSLVRALNYIKFPAPTIQVYPDVKFHLLYPIKF